MDQIFFLKTKKHLQTKIKDRWEKFFEQLKLNFEFKKNYDLSEQIIHFIALYLLSEVRCEDFKPVNQKAKKTKKFRQSLKRVQKSKAELSSLGNGNILTKELDDIIDDCQHLELKMQTFISKIPSSKTGPKSSSTYKDLIRFLCAIFVEGTGKAAQCKKKCDAYEGEVYEFLIAVKTLITTLGHELGKDETIGIYIIEIIEDGSLETIKRIKEVSSLPDPFKHTAWWAYSE